VETAGFFEMLVLLYQTTWCHIPGDHNLERPNHSCDNFKSVFLIPTLWQTLNIYSIISQPHRKKILYLVTYEKSHDSDPATLTYIMFIYTYSGSLIQHSRKPVPVQTKTALNYKCNISCTAANLRNCWGASQFFTRNKSQIWRVYHHSPLWSNI